MKKLFLSLMSVSLIWGSGFAAAPAQKSSSPSKPAPQSSSSSQKSSAAPSSSKSNSSASKISLNGGKFAVGYVQTDFGLNSLGIDRSSSLAVRYCASANANKFSIEGIFGFSVGDGPESFAIGAKGIYDLKTYPSFNVYAFGGANYASINLGLGSGSQSLFSLTGGVGIEYFILSNLSVSTELGVRAVFGDNYTHFGLLGNWISNLGVRYYLDI